MTAPQHPDHFCRDWIADLLDDNRQIGFAYQELAENQNRETPASDSMPTPGGYDNMRWSLGLQDGQVALGPDDAPRMYVLPDGSRINSCDQAREDWMLWCETLGLRIKEVAEKLRDDTASEHGDDDAPIVVSLLSQLETIAAATVAVPIGAAKRELTAEERAQLASQTAELARQAGESVEDITP